MDYLLPVFEKQLRHLQLMTQKRLMLVEVLDATLAAKEPGTKGESSRLQRLA